MNAIAAAAVPLPVLASVRADNAASLPASTLITG